LEIIDLYRFVYLTAQAWFTHPLPVPGKPKRQAPGNMPGIYQPLSWEVGSNFTISLPFTTDICRLAMSTTPRNDWNQKNKKIPNQPEIISGSKS